MQFIQDSLENEELVKFFTSVGRLFQKKRVQSFKQDNN